MKLEIKQAIDKGDKIILKMEYDQDFADAVANIFGIKHASERQVEAFVTTVIENMDEEDLGELGYEIDE
jgi:adenylyl- and sulfurtransferase ThiI